VLVALAMLSACHAGARPDAAPAPAAPEAAVQAFLAAVDSNAIDRMAALWGDANGPPTDRRILREREQRLTIMQRLLQHDAFQFVPAPAGGAVPRTGRRMVWVELRSGGTRATVPFTVVGQRHGGWLVEDIGLEALMPAGTPRRTTTP
jgi:hypothetical protein